VADAVTPALEALARSDAMELDDAYRQAAQLAAADRQTWTAVAFSHIEGLQQLSNAALALRRCTEYLDEPGEHQMDLRLLRAQIHSGLGDHSSAAADAAAVRALQRHRPDCLTADDHARLHRVEALSAADRGELGEAAQHLDKARQFFLEAGNQAGVAAIELDRSEIELRQGRQAAVFDVLAGQGPDSVAEYRLIAMELRRQSRYEEALHVLWHCMAGDDLDPALAWHVLHDIIVLLRLLRRNELADALLPALERLVEASPSPAAGRDALDRVRTDGTPSDAFSPRFDRRLQHARRLIAGAQLGEAERLLAQLRPHARTDRDLASWHLAAGELQLAKPPTPTEIRSRAHAAISHLSEAAARARTAALTEIRVCALRSLGRAHARLDDKEAAQLWAAAHRLEEEIAKRQVSDDARIGMLQAAPDEYDERIRAAAERHERCGPEAAAAIVVAMEAARGAMILESILPGQDGLARDLPGPSDLDGAWRWVTGIADGLPPAQVIWIMHSAPDRVHHAVIGRELLHYEVVPSRKRALEDAIERLMTCWEGEETLELSITGGEFATSLTEVARQTGISVVVAGLPQQVRRIAIVAGGELSDIPFAAVTTPGADEPLGLRYALSDLPCLSARLPLHQRSHRRRGERLLLVSPPDATLTRASGRPAHPLDGEDATVERLREELGRRRHHQVRIDSHGQHKHARASRSWLQLAPAGPAGRLWAHDLQRMDLSGCGTLVLGACESGMAQRTGRDERVGFVRAGLSAGAAAVVAARWVAADPVAATVLDRFERYVRYLPRDLALQHAQLDVYRGAPGTPVDLPALEHPARWACWTLYGDSGWQTGALRVRRSLRRGLDRWRRRV
jgi:hypothetical protein